MLVQKLVDKQQTADEMTRLVRDFAADIDRFHFAGRPLSQLPPELYHHLIREIPYTQDVRGVEVVTRPYLMLALPWRGWDCKKKGIAMAAYAERNNIPWRFVAVSRQPNGQIHHVVTQYRRPDGSWYDMDATYSWSRPGNVQQWTNIEPLNGDPTAPAEAKLISMYGTGEPSAEMRDDFCRAGKMAGVDLQNLYMGEPVTAIITGAGVIASSIIAAVAGKRRQDRARKQAKKSMEQSSQIIEQKAREHEKLLRLQAEMNPINNILSMLTHPIGLLSLASVVVLFAKHGR